MGRPSLGTLAKEAKLEALERKQREMYCCRASRWTKSIGWFQCLFHGFGSAGILYAIGGLIWSCMHKAPLKPEELLESRNFQAKLPLLFVVLFVLLFTVSGGFLMGTVLLQGAYKKDTSLLCWWRAYAWFSLGIYTMLTVAISFPPSVTSWVTVVVLVGTVIIQVFCIWIVGIRRQEIFTHKERKLVAFSELVS
ncbi:unnamed protein product [Allacma fusca]|uniref:Uncharacterized protein n=1 Tax=Allacma fusca TaxID=39272 RepID=A0A8J2P8G6_9HEXA|nr:unnamed protein product [Allacma fusca]